MADILIVDDEETLLATISLELQRSGHDCATVSTAEQALEKLASYEPQLALVDIRLPDLDGVTLIQRMRQAGHDFPILVMTAYGSVEGAVAAMKVGATDYLQKPVGIAELELVIDRALQNRRLIDRLDVLERERQRRGDERAIIGRSPAMRSLLELVDKVAAVPADEQSNLPTVLITGESGTGKDLIAHRLHDLGPRRDAPFVQINCSALLPSLVEAELFGYERGAFTDAKTNKKGLFEAAGEGTVFLDEIGDMPLALQAQLLLVLEQRVFRRLGGTRERRVHARTLAATNCNLTRLVSDGRFRKDLLFRLQSLAVECPPLRARGDDLLLLAEHFINRQARRLHREPPALSETAREAMRRYSWPGNVRELDNVLQRAVLLNEHGSIKPAEVSLNQEHLTPQAVNLDKLMFPFGREAFTLTDIEQRVILQAIDYCQGNTSEAARLLGMSRGALRHRLEKLPPMSGTHEPRSD